MTPKEQATRQALEALEVYGEHAKDCPQYPTYTRPQDYPKCDCGFEEAITALREALDHFRDATKKVAEQAEQEPSVSDGLCGGCAKKAADGWALYCVECWEKGNGQSAINEPAANAHVSNADSDSLSDVKQEPVYAFRRKGLDDFCTCDERRYLELSDKPNLFETTIFYTTPPSVEAMRLETLEKAAQVCEQRDIECHEYFGADCAAAIRGMK